MAFSLRDEKGQGIVEYILVLVVAVGIVLGLLHQLNSAFKEWTNNYFGNYLACLLETGELPTISGNPGDSGICNELFKPFELGEGRPLRTQAGASRGGSSGQGRGQRGGGYSGGGGSASGGGGGGPFQGSGRRVARSGSKKQISKGGASYTGNTGFSSSGYGYNTSSPRRIPINQRLDTKFAFDDRQERMQRRQIASAPVKPFEGGQRSARIPLRAKVAKKAQTDTADTSFSIAGFLRFLIIAAIIIAIVMFLGGQALKISKSMNAT